MSENKTYSATVSAVSDEGVKNIATATGSFTLANFAAKQGFAAIKDGSGEYRVTFAEVNEDGETVRNIASVTADADVVTYVAKKKIAAERKALNPADSGDADE